MSTRRLWMTTVLLASIAGLVHRGVIVRFEPAAQAADPEIYLKPPLGTGVGNFAPLDGAIDDGVLTSSQSFIVVDCTTTCLNEIQKVAVWQGFPSGAEPLRLEIRWDGTGGIQPLAQAQAYFLVEYDIGTGWQIAEEDLWLNSIPTCSTTHPAACDDHVYVKQLDATVNTGNIKVRATHRMKMNACATPCESTVGKYMNATMDIRNIQVVAKAPTLEVDPSSTITRGEAVTFWVKKFPVGTTFSNWRYEMSSQPTIVRTAGVNTDTWTGEVVVSGTAKVVATIPRNPLSVPLSLMLTITPRDWNSEPKAPPLKTTGLGPIPSPPQPAPAKMGWALIVADFLWDGRLIPDGPNKGLSYVSWVNHATVSTTRAEYEISPDVEPGAIFYQRQCGAGGFISGAVLRANGYEHESGTTKGHYQQYKSKLAEPAVNYAKWAEWQIGSVSGGYGTFSSFIYNALVSRKSQIHTAASFEACNSDWTKDVNCNSQGNINWPPYQPPCQ